MTIRDLMELFVDDQELKIYDLDKDKTIYEGNYSDLEIEYEDMEITSIDNIGVGYGNTTVVININSEE